MYAYIWNPNGYKEKKCMQVYGDKGRKKNKWLLYLQILELDATVIVRNEKFASHNVIMLGGLGLSAETN